MSYYQISETGVANLNKLADFLLIKNNPNMLDFDMSVYAIGENGTTYINDFFVELEKELDPSEVIECGTCACALGHGVFAGILPSSPGQSWTNYGIEHFDLYPHTPFWSFCFGSSWPNDPIQAGRRIKYLLSVLGTEKDDTRELNKANIRFNEDLTFYVEEPLPQWNKLPKTPI